MQKLLQISAGVFFYGLPEPQQGKPKIPATGLRNKTENKGFVGGRAQTLPALQRVKRKIPAPGLRIKTGNKGFAGSRAQTAPALQRGKRKIPAPGLHIKTENKGFAGSRAQTAPARKKPSPFVSEWGKRRRHIRIIQFWVLRKTVAGAIVFFMGY